MLPTIGLSNVDMIGNHVYSNYYCTSIRLYQAGHYERDPLNLLLQKRQSFFYNLLITATLFDILSRLEIVLQMKKKKPEVGLWCSL